MTDRRTDGRARTSGGQGRRCPRALSSGAFRGKRPRTPRWTDGLGRHESPRHDCDRFAFADRRGSGNSPRLHERTHVLVQPARAWCWCTDRASNSISCSLPWSGRPDLCRVGAGARAGGPGRSSTRRRGRSGNKWLGRLASHVPAAAAVSGAKRNVPTCRRARTSDVIGRALVL